MFTRGTLAVFPAYLAEIRAKGAAQGLMRMRTAAGETRWWEFNNTLRAEEQTQRYLEELETAFMSTVEVATTMSALRDPYNTGHERRVAEIAVAIGAELGFDERRQEGLRVAGCLHDCGKIKIPAEFLSKPGKLSALELYLVRGHAQAGYDVLKGVTFPRPVAEIERGRGSAYDTAVADCCLRLFRETGFKIAES